MNIQISVYGLAVVTDVPYQLDCSCLGGPVYPSNSPVVSNIGALS
ncbi:predicted protein [Botrytis cinerea T4]|uniref:Uncharacterized protein n=1 Tax=Botryotinia fuckeliana (strain T4) TaxID=999810 RepID=G2YFZ4_BOTF4|nr:predicted protein [Botrytis cinerea T4]